MPNILLLQCIFFIKQTFHIEKKKPPFKCLACSELICQSWISIYHYLLLHFFQLSLFLLCINFAVFIAVCPIHVQSIFNILHIFCLNLCDIYFFLFMQWKFSCLDSFSYLSYHFPLWWFNVPSVLSLIAIVHSFSLHWSDFFFLSVSYLFIGL